MLKHLLRLMWNKKKQNFLLISEIFVSFLVLFAVFSLLVTFWQNYNKPLGFDPENVWVIRFSNGTMTKDTDSLNMTYETLRKAIQSQHPVKNVSFVSFNTPFASAQQLTGFSYHEKQSGSVNLYQVEDPYKDILKVHLLKGRWFDKQDRASAHRPIVINATLEETIFGKTASIGQLIGGDKDKEQDKMQVIGVVEDMKFMGDYQSGGKAMYTRIDTGSFHYIDDLLVRVSPDAGAAFEGYLYKVVANTLKNSNIEIRHLADMRVVINKVTLVPTTIILIVAGFLIINVAFGLLGVLWYNINKRRGEIGLRRAVGATRKAVSVQLLCEALILATFSIIAGTFFAIQFPLLHIFDKSADVYILALIFTILFIYLLVAICSLYPGRQAAAIYPAVALYEE